MVDYEKLGQFYLGEAFDLTRAERTGELVLYDAKDLTTHAVIVGMTGSGKTGLGVALLEEAAIDGIPAIVIDPKGDLGNLLLSFPQLTPEEFEPWIDRDEAHRKARSVKEFAADRAELWRTGLADWDQTPERIQKYRESADVAIYTPGSDAGLPLTVLKSLDAPPSSVLESSDAMRERVSSTACGLCSLLGVDADPIRSREHILISSILDQAWRAGRSLDMAGLVYEIQTPSVRKIGVMDVDQMFPATDRMSLAMRLNSVLASPSFAGWMQGEPLDIQRLLFTEGARPRLSILSIAHLSEQERMFFVTILLNELIAWMRSQPGTSSLRAILYMDEVFGYLPPTANPPSKLPLLTLLKQARAYGLGLVLATQNPVDLDYKALSNAGTWFLGRLQTERDKLRVLDGLEGASAQSGASFNRSEIEKILSAVGQRVFLLNNVHEDRPVVFQTRWALSYLAGPMTREQIQSLMRDRRLGSVRPSADAGPDEAGRLAPMSAAPIQNSGSVRGEPEVSRRPLLPESIEQRFEAVSRAVSRGARIQYRPALIGLGKLHYVDSKSNLDVWLDVVRVCSAAEEPATNPWGEAEVLDGHPPAWERSPDETASWMDLPAGLTKASNYRSWGARLKEELYRGSRLTLQFCPPLAQFSPPGESEGDFRVHLRQQAREQRDLEIARLRAKYGDRIARQESAIRAAEHRVGTEQEQAKNASLSAWVSTGTSILGALLGRKKLSSTNISRAGTAARAHGRASQQQADIARAEEKLQSAIEQKEQMEAELEAEIQHMTETYDAERLPIEAYEVTPRKSDIVVSSVQLLWRPWADDGQGGWTPAWEQG